MLTRVRAAIPLVALALTLSLAAAPLVAGVAPFNLTISPSVLVSLGSTITMTLSVSGGTRNTAYGVIFGVVKPNGTGSATVSRTVITDNRGNGAITQFYPDPSFTAVSGTVATDVGGVYNVYVNQTSPTNIINVATGTFTVSSKLNVVISQPVPGIVVQRGQTTTISATVSALSGPDNAAVVHVYSPSMVNLTLQQTSPGVYTYNYLVSASDPTGTWTLAVSANSINDGSGNTGPDLATSVPLQVITSPLSYWPFVVAGIVAVLGGIVTVKRFDTSLEGFQHLEQMMGGPLPRGASILLLGDIGSGKTILSYQLLHDELESGRLCALLSYDAFPEDVQARMTDFG